MNQNSENRINSNSWGGGLLTGLTCFDSFSGRENILDDYQFIHQNKIEEMEDEDKQKIYKFEEEDSSYKRPESWSEDDDPSSEEWSGYNPEVNTYRNPGIDDGDCLNIAKCRIW